VTKKRDVTAPDLAAPALLCAARACYGGLLLCAPHRMVALGAGHPAGPRAAAVARLLGTRHLLQAAATAAVLTAAVPETARSAALRPGRVLLAGAARSPALPPGRVLLAGAARSPGLRPGPVLLAGAGVDALHAASMIGLAAVCRPYRRAARADVLLEAGFAAFGIITGRRQPGSPRSRGSLLIDA
jgi:hypothetical protein